MRFIQHDAHKPPHLPGACGVSAAAVATCRSYERVRAEFGPALKADGSISVRDMDRYLRPKGFLFHKSRAKLLTEAPLPPGRLVVYTRLRREGREFGHFAAVIGHTLLDNTDTRDGVLLNFWERAPSWRDRLTRSNP